MLIQCTKKLLDELEIKPVQSTEEDPLFSWHANIITINHRKTVVLCNDSNRYITVLHGLKAKDFKNIGTLITSVIRETLLAECIKSEIIERFINHAPVVSFAKTSDKSMVARMNKACDNVYIFMDCFIADTNIQTEVGIRASSLLVGDYTLDSRQKPSEAMYKDLVQFGEVPIFRCKVAVLKVKLDLKNHDVWRRVIVPVNITFPQLHNIMQIVFGWQDYHLHNFHIFDGDRPIVNLVCGDDAFEYQNELPMIMETGIKLSEYIPKYNKIKYTYDFGDNWEHNIEIEKVIDNYDMNYPICLEAVGDAPPEDVGGEGGYDEFFEAISDPKHPENKAMIEWGRWQQYKDFNLDFVNRRLKYSMRRI